MSSDYCRVTVSRLGPGNPRPAAIMIGTSIPGPGRIGKRGFPVSRFPPNRESGIPRFPILAESGIGPRGSLPDSRPNRESGERPGELGIWASGPRNLPLPHEPLTAAADVRWRPEISIFEDQRQHLAPGSCLVLHGMSIPDFPIFGQIGNRGFPVSRFWPNRESGVPSPIPGGNPRFPAKSGMGGTGIGDFRV
jgi:hypothetical protein